MDRREVRMGTAAVSLLGGLMSPQALASTDQSLETRLVQLEADVGVLDAGSPSALLTRCLRRSGLSERTFSHILSADLVEGSDAAAQAAGTTRVANPTPELEENERRVGELSAKKKLLAA